MNLTPAYMRARWPGVFEDPPCPDFALQEAINAAVAQVGQAWGTQQGEAQALLAAHFAELGKPGRAEGAISGSAGQVSISFLADGDALKSTAFGRLFLALRRKSIFPVWGIG